MYVCGEGAAMYPRKESTGVLVKRNGKTLMKKRDKKSVGQEHRYGSGVQGFHCRCQYVHCRCQMFPPPAACSCCSMLVVPSPFMTYLLYY